MKDFGEKNVEQTGGDPRGDHAIGGKIVFVENQIQCRHHGNQPGEEHGEIERASSRISGIRDEAHRSTAVVVNKNDCAHGAEHGAVGADEA